MINWNEQERVRQLLTEAVTVLCKNGLKYSSKFCVEGLLGITLDDNDILLVNIKETIGTGGASGISMAPVQVKSPPMMSRSPMGMGHRMAMTSPRRGRAKPVMSRGRGGFGFNRKRALFSSPMKNTASPMRPIGSPPQQQLAMPLPDQSGLTEGPSPKMKREEDPAGSADDDVIEIGDEDDAATAHTTQPDDEATIKQEIQDQPSSSTDPQQQQQQDSKFTLDNETNKSLTDFLDNLMTQHDVGPNSSSNQAARGGAPLSQMSQISPKAEPMNIPWEHSQSVGYSSPPGHSTAPQFHSPSQQSQETSEPGIVDVRPMVSIMDAGTLRLPNLQRVKARKVQRKLKSSFPDVSMMHNEDKSNSSEVESFTTYVCQICKSTFGTQSGLRNHQSQHYSNPESGFFCENCAIRFNSQASLYRHKRLVHSAGGRKYIHNCEYCHKGYFNKTDLVEHLYNHTKIPGFTCDQCDERFRSKVMLRNHKRDHQRDRVLAMAHASRT